MTSRLDAISKRAERASPQTPRTTAERIYHDDGGINYEVHDEHHLVVFAEESHKPIMKAKFNAELYAHARADIPHLLNLVREAREALNLYADERNWFAYDSGVRCRKVFNIIDLEQDEHGTVGGKKARDFLKKLEAE